MAKTGLLGFLGWPKPDDPGAKKAPGPTQKKQARSNPYQAVSIAYPGKCCADIKSLAGQRFFACDAPSLPLSTCTLSDQCKCSFRKHDDRRESDRRLPGEMGKWYGGVEKRRSRDRRRTK